MMALALAPFAERPVAEPPYADAYLGQQVINAVPDGSNVYTFSDVTIGAADARRRVILVFGTQGGTACNHDACTANAGAITFTKVIQSQAGTNNNQNSIWQALVAAGTTLTAPKLTCSAAPARATLHSFAHGRGVATNQLGTISSSGTIDVPADGLTIMHSSATSSTALDAPWTGVGLTEDYDSNQVSTLYNSGGRYVNDAVADTGKTVAPAWTGTPSNIRIVAASFGAQV